MRFRLTPRSITLDDPGLMKFEFSWSFASIAWFLGWGGERLQEWR